MSDVDSEVIDRFNVLADRRFLLELDKERLNREFKDEEAARKKKHEEALARLQRHIDKVDSELWGHIEGHRATLFQRGKKSFATMAAKFQLRLPAAKVKVTDKEGILKVARRLSVVREIADPPKGGWRLNQAKFLKWLEKNGEYRLLFDDYLEDVSDQESLTIQPNGTYTVHYDNQRISPPSVSIKKQES